MGAEIKIIRVDEQSFVGIRRTTEIASLKDTLGEIFGATMAYVQASGGQPSGMPFSIYHNMTGDTVDVESGLPVSEAMPGAGEVQPGVLPSAKVAAITHTGPYDDLSKTWGRLFDWINAQGLEPAGPPWEVYVTDPGMEPDASKWRTDIFFPVG